MNFRIALNVEPKCVLSLENQLFYCYLLVFLNEASQMSVLGRLGQRSASNKSTGIPSRLLERFCLSSKRFSLTYSADLLDTIDSGHLHHDPLSSTA